MIRLGVQVSIAGKIYASVERAKKLGCNTMQIFARNPRKFRRASLGEKGIKIFKRKVKKEGIDPVVVHIPYTLNLAAAKSSFYKITIREFIADLVEADTLGANYLVTHVGSHKGSTESKGLIKIIKALEEILKATSQCKTTILLENTSGSGSWLGYKFSHQRLILENLNWPARLGLCLDTAHAWAAGYEINNVYGLNRLLEEIDCQLGLERLKIIHLNDTPAELNSRQDKHLAIGEGFIGEEGFRALINHSKLKSLPFILETPKESDEDDIKNLNIVRKLRGNAG